MDPTGGEIPDVYASYFALRCDGLDRSEIAERLEVPIETMDSFIALAHAKLASRR